MNPVESHLVVNVAPKYNDLSSRVAELQQSLTRRPPPISPPPWHRSGVITTHALLYRVSFFLFFLSCVIVRVITPSCFLRKIFIHYFRTFRSGITSRPALGQSRVRPTWSLLKSTFGFPDVSRGTRDCPPRWHRHSVPAWSFDQQ